MKAKVGFILSFDEKWMGGINYFKNLFYALNKYEIDKLKIVLFTGKKTPSKYLNDFSSYAIIVRSSLFDRYSPLWLTRKLSIFLLRNDFVLSFYLKRKKVNIISHSPLSIAKGIKTLYWIPDFQHIHLEEMFSKKEVLSRNQYFKNLIEYGTKIILSSDDAFNDFKNFASKNNYNKVGILKFVSQPNQNYFKLNQKDCNYVKKTYNLEDDFIYLPNQFWKHKNHFLVFKAIKLLVDKNIKVQLVCSGSKKDSRNIGYYDELSQYIIDNELEDNIKILGLIPYEDLFKLIKFSKFVLNPSLFEGWSSTVEECKSVGKKMLLSDLPVHKEQLADSVFFNRYSEVSLANTIEKIFDGQIKQSDNNNNKNVLEDLEKRTKKFANDYVEIIEDLI